MILGMGYCVLEDFNISGMGEYQLFQELGGEFRWHLRDMNGEIICWAEGFMTKQMALDAIECNRLNAADAPLVEL